VGRGGGGGAGGGRGPAHEPSDALAKEIQEHVKAATAPYKYPRVVDFASELPKTPSGKIRRAALRAERVQ
jgi:acyl-coenzyme A synthetase/AMP-(fatty) acid ligase